MATDDMAFWQWALERAGFPIVTLLLIGIATVRVVKWFKPWIERIFQKQLDFIDRTVTLLQASGESQRKQEELLLRLSADVREMRGEMIRMAESVAANTHSNTEIVRLLAQILQKGSA